MFGGAVGPPHSTIFPWGGANGPPRQNITIGVRTMVIEELKPSRHVEGRWLAVLEDGSILRVGEGEVVGFALYAGKELSEEEAERLQDAARRSGLKAKAIELLMRKPQSRRELGRKLREWEAGEEEIEAICDRMEELGYLNEPDGSSGTTPRRVSASGRSGMSSTAGASPGSCGMRPCPRSRTTAPPSTPFWRRSSRAVTTPRM